MLVSITGSQTESRAMVFSTWIEIKTFLSNFFFFFQINFYVQELFVSFYPYLPTFIVRSSWFDCRQETKNIYLVDEKKKKKKMIAHSISYFSVGYNVADVLSVLRDL